MWNNDTVVAITEGHLDKINVVKVERDACYDAMWESSQTIDSLSLSIDRYKMLVNVQHKKSVAQDSLIWATQNYNKDLKKGMETNGKIATGSIILNIILIAILIL